MLLALAALAAGQSVAARAESTAPRTVAVRMVGAPESVREIARPEALIPAAVPAVAPRVTNAPPPAAAPQRSTPLYLLHRALLR